MFFFFALIAKEPFPEPGNPINKHVLLFYVVKADALKGRAPFLGRIKLANLNRDFFISPANCVPSMVIFCWAGLIAVIMLSSVPEIPFETLSYPPLNR